MKFIGPELPIHVRPVAHTEYDRAEKALKAKPGIWALVDTFEHHGLKERWRTHLRCRGCEVKSRSVKDPAGVQPSKFELYARWPEATR